MEILKYPKYKDIVACSGCGCVFKFDEKDMDITIAETAEQNYILYKCVVYCPVCKLPEKVEFGESSNE